MVHKTREGGERWWNEIEAIIPNASNDDFMLPVQRCLTHTQSAKRQSSEFRDLIARGYEDEIASYQGRPVEAGTDVLITFVRCTGADTDHDK